MHAQQAEQIMGARITLLVPIAVVLFMRVSFPDADRFYTSPGGELLLLVCGLAMLLGYWFMLKIGRVGLRLSAVLILHKAGCYVLKTPPKHRLQWALFCAFSSWTITI